MITIPYRQIRAKLTNNTIQIYQAYSNKIADSILKEGFFCSPLFKKDRMTWIKPSFLWMMYRSEWSCKICQERILAINITRKGFEWALQNSCLSHFDHNIYNSNKEWLYIKQRQPVVIQWDPERDIYFNKLDYRSIQIGLSGEAVERYTQNWIVDIQEITSLCQNIQELLINKQINSAINLLPKEEEYPLPILIKNNIGITSS